MDELGVLDLGAKWLGRSRLGARIFKNQFGVYPRTVCFLLEKCRVCSKLGAERLLKALWWMKTYPTEQELHNKRVSAAYFRTQLWELLKAMNNELPEVNSLAL